MPETDTPALSLQERLAMRDRQVAAVHRISEALFSKNDLDALLRETLHACLDTVEAEAGSILLYDASKRKLVFRSVVGKTELIGLEIDPETDLNGRAAAVFRTGKPLLTSNVEKGSYNPTFDAATGFRTQSILTVPIKNLGGAPIGVLQALNKRHGDFGEDDLELLEIISSLATTSIVNARLAEEAQLAAVARAVGDLSHDIKNALTPIQTMMETTVDAFLNPMYAEIDRLLIHDNVSADSVRDAVQPLRDWYPEMYASVEDGCADIREMVAEIADYIKGAQAAHFEVQDIKSVIEDRLRRLKTVARNRRVQIHLEATSDLPPFAFDRRLIGRAVFNLVNNALNAIEYAVRKEKLTLRPEGFNIWVRLSAATARGRSNAGYCLLEVQDDGPGIPAKVKETLFTPQVISTTPGGTGIGTRFVHSVAEAHGGQVGVESEAGCGARFWMKIPLEHTL